MVQLGIIQYRQAFGLFLISCWKANRWLHLDQLPIPNPNKYGHGSRVSEDKSLKLIRKESPVPPSLKEILNAEGFWSQQPAWCLENITHVISNY